jgi:hypothetical protein
MSFSTWERRQSVLSPSWYWMRDLGMTGLVDTRINWKASQAPGVRWSVDNAMWTLGKEHPLDDIDEFQKYSLAGVAQRIKGDVLLLAGQEDHFVPFGQVNSAGRTVIAAASTFEQAERQAILDALTGASGRIAGKRGAAERLGLKRTTLQNKIRRLSIARADYSA